MKKVLRVKSVFAIAGTLIFVFAASAFVSAQTAAKKVAEIKRIVAERDRMAATAEGDDYSDVFIIELKVNPKENQYPAVGTFTSTAKFYYTYSPDREKHPYPNKLVKVAVTTRRSSTTERTTIYFRGPGEMILYSKKVEGEEASERSMYILAGLPLEYEKQGMVVSTKGADATAFLKTALADKTRFEKIFQAALD
jgi:hypothetical protein